jgi:hypothetical protein
MNTIFQMTLGRSSRGEVGLVFSSEVEAEVAQSPIFVIPIPDSAGSPFHYMSEQRFRFPALLGDKAIDVESEKLGQPFPTFRLPFLPERVGIAFEPRLLPRAFWRGWRRGDDIPSLLRYIGKDERMDTNVWYAPISAINALELDDLYRQRRFAFVGLTPAFGDWKEESPRFR